MNKFLLILLSCILITCTGCSASKATVTDTTSKPVSWYIFTDDFAPDSALGYYHLISDVFAKNNIDVDITFVSSLQAEEVIGKMIRAGKLADIITMERYDLNKYKLVSSNLIYDIEKLDQELFETIPDQIRNDYCDANGKLFCIPGGYNNAAKIPMEGLFVRSEFYDILGKPDMSTNDGFYRAVRQFTEFYKKTYSSNPIPILFGKNLKGLKTFEHVFGVMPVKKSDGLFYHRLFSENMKESLYFMSKLAEQSSAVSLKTADDYIFDTIMKNNVFACFSPEGDIRLYNQANPQEKFIRIDAPLSKNGFYESFRQSGNFITYIFKNTLMSQEVVRIIKALSSEESSLSFMYGEEDKAWVRSNGSVRIIQSYKNMIRKDITESNNYGLSAFPFLSNAGYSNPYIYDPNEYACDVSENQYIVTPTSYCAVYVKKMDEYCMSIYSDCLTSQRPYRAIIDQINDLKNNSLEGIYSEEVHK